MLFILLRERGVKVADGGCPQLQDRPQNSSPSRARMESEHCLMVRYDLDHRYKAPAPSVVDRVLLTANETDQFLVKVMVRQSRRPEIGDKFASRHGQKGVCGAIISQVSKIFVLFLYLTLCNYYYTGGYAVYGCGNMP
mmetsp:Transcript_8512/g.21711  ORF Transcript_8512/g.21711 Transcript_8512/m.21711 type:complete len:138 (-) Transcript_8512:977-1390(-)